MATDENRESEADRVGNEPVRAPSAEELGKEDPLHDPARPQVDDEVLDPELDDEEALRRERDPMSR